MYFYTSCKMVIPRGLEPEIGTRNPARGKPGLTRLTRGKSRGRVAPFLGRVRPGSDPALTRLTRVRPGTGTGHRFFEAGQPGQSRVRSEFIGLK